METRIYSQRKFYEKLNANHFALFLNEEIVQNFIPEDDDSDSSNNIAPFTAYKYTGTSQDGSTVVESTSDSIDDIRTALFRLKYSNGSSENIYLDYVSRNGKQDESQRETDYLEMEDYRSWCLLTATEVLSRR